MRTPASRYRHEVRRLLGSVPAPTSGASGADLDDVPPPVARWLRRVGVVGRPPTVSFRARSGMRIRGGPDEAWMSGTAEQHGFFRPVARLFLLKARRAGIPVHVFHRYVGAEATFEARLLGLLPVVRASGPELTRSETVTVLNDMFLFAPSALLHAGVEWEMRDGERVGVTWSHADRTVSAEVGFDDAGDLTGFDSDDRSAHRPDDPDGPFVRRHWSTPVLDHADFGGLRLPARAEARWTEPSGESWSYAELELEEVDHDPAPAV